MNCCVLQTNNNNYQYMIIVLTCPYNKNIKIHMPFLTKFEKHVKRQKTFR